MSGAQAAPTRPEWVPESHWDADAGSLKLDEFGQHYGELAALKKQHDDRLAALPQKPEDVKFALPEGVQVPEGFALDDANPMFADARELVVSKKIDPAVANEFLGVYVKHQLAEQKMIGDRLEAEKAKLGANYETRVDALNSGLVAAIGKDNTIALIGDVTKPNGSRLFTAAQVNALEAVLKRITSQGGIVPLGGAHQTPPPPPQTIEQRWYGNSTERKAS